MILKIWELGLFCSILIKLGHKTDMLCRMPSSEITIVDIKKLVGSQRKVDVIDTLTQDSTTMTLGQWSKYYQSFPRQRLLNIISLEISCTKLGLMVNSPDMVNYNLSIVFVCAYTLYGQLTMYHWID